MKKLLSTILSVAVAGISILPLSATAAASTAVPSSAKAAVTDNYNYGEALQKAVMFYEFQRSGKAAPDQRNNWRGDSGMSDGSDVGVDLTGGYYDAGDHVKFNLPMSYTSTMLAWDVYENKASLEKSGQLSYMKSAIKWITDYLIKCHPSANEFYYQVGDGSLDHSWWGPSEVMQMKRPSYKVDLQNPGSTVSGEAAAALASAAIVFKDDPTYSASCLKNAEELFNFAATTLSDSGYTAASGYYNSWSGFYDELSWAATWLYLATGDKTYLDKAESYVPQWGTEQQTTTIAYKWAQNWDDVHYGAQLLLARITGKSIYKESCERNLDFWTTGYNGDKITYTPKGLAYLSQWGSLRYATTQAFLAAVYAKWSGCSPEKATVYNAFAKSQVDYALGSTGRSFEIGFGTNYPQHPHHRTAESSWADSQTTPDYCRHTLIGALVGGPDSSDSFSDEVSNYSQTEPACDYNAGFIDALTELYGDYGGTPVAGLNANEKPTNSEFFVRASVNASGNNFEEIKAVLYNESGWPARVGDKLSYKYFIDISELVKAGYSAKDVKISTNYNAGATVSGLTAWDAANNIYYVNVDFTGTKIYPGGQSAYQKECQFRISYPENVNVYDNSNDFSFKGVNPTAGGTPTLDDNIPVYDGGTLVYGNEPSGDVKSATIDPTSATFDLNTEKQADVTVAVTANGNTLNGIYNGDTALVKGTDYTVNDDGSVTILKAYLAKQPVGTLNLKFDFSAGKDPVLTIKIIDTTPVVSSTITPTEASFDLNAAKQADVNVTVTLNGNTLLGIYNGDTALVKGTDYTVNDDGTVTILKAYLAKQPVGTLKLTFDFSKGDDPVLTITVKDSTPSSTITPTEAFFDLNAAKQADVNVTITPNGNTLLGIYNGDTALVKDTDYTVNDDGTITILKAYLAKQPVGTLKLTFDFSAGTDPVLTITVTDSTPVVDSTISPTSAAFDKNVANAADVNVTVTLNGNTLLGIYNGTTALVKGTDYTVNDDGTVTILKAYLAKQPVGTLKLTFDFSKGDDPVLTITITDSTPPAPCTLKLQMFCANTQSSTNGIMPRFRLYNLGDSPLDLSKVKIRYYYTSDGAGVQNFWCDWSSVGSSNVTSSFNSMSSAAPTADTYLEIGFTTDAGTLAPGANVEIQARFSKTDWSNYNQANDYSFDATDSGYTDWTKATVYYDDSLSWGVEP